MKKQFLIFAMCLCSVVIWAHNFSAVAPTGQTLYYSFTSGTEVDVVSPTNDWSWSGYTKPTGNLTIPSSVTYEGTTYSVTGIGGYALSGCDGLTSVIIPNSVIDIKPGAFTNCRSLTNIIIPNSVTYIREYAFSGCSSLSHIIIPNSVTVIEPFAFESIPIVYYRGEATGSPWEASQVITTTYTEGVLTYESPYKTMVLECSHEATDVIIPNSVFYIENEAFSGCEYLTQLTIPPSVTYIGKYAFEGCRNMTILYYQAKNLSSTEDWYDDIYDCFTCGFRDMNLQMLVIGDSVETIPANVFYGRYGLFDSITIPNSVKTIGDHAFDNCGNLTRVTFGNSLTSIGDYAFANCENLDNVTIPSSVEEIGENAFYDGVKTVIYCGTATGAPWGAQKAYGAFRDSLYFEDCGMTIVNGYVEGLTNANIPSTVTTIAENAFKNCTTLTRITIPNSVTTVGDSAFSGCTGLQMVSIGEAVTYIGTFAFEGCTNVDTMYYNAINLGNTGSWQYEGYGFQPMQLDTLVIGSKVQSLPEDVFRQQSNLTSITLPNSVKTIGNYAFAGCINLSHITLGDSLTTIGISAFNGCRSLTGRLTIPNSVTSVSPMAFSGCSGLKTVSIGESVTFIGTFAFKGCTNVDTMYYNAINLGNTDYWENENQGFKPMQLDTLVIGSKVQSLPKYVFSQQNNLNSVIIPNSVTTVGEFAFAICESLSNVTFGDSVTTIGWSAFNGCGSLTGSLTIPNSVTTIGDFAFADCVSLNNVTIGDSVTSIGMNAFHGCRGLTNVVIPNSVTSIDKYAFGRCSGLTSVTIPSSVTTIGDSAFYDGVRIVYYCGEATGAPWGAQNVYGALRDSLYYQDCDMTIVSGYVGGLTSAIIPDGVTAIAANAFFNCTTLTSVTIPNSVRNIGNRAFYNCLNLGNVNFGNSVTCIESWAFGNCNFTDITIPNSVATIGDHAFNSCANLRSVTFGDSLTSIGSYVFSLCYQLDNVTIPSSVISISENAFNDVKTVIYCGTATGAPWGAEKVYGARIDSLYYNCDMTTVSGFVEGLTNANIPDGVTTIAANAFKNCTTLTSVTIPSSVTTIENHAFTGCTNVTTLHYNATDLATSDSWRSYTTYGFRPMPIQTLVVGDNVETLPDYVFCRLGQLADVTLPETLTVIGDYAFYYCSGLASINLPETLAAIGENAFNGCSSLNNVTIPSLVTTISNGTFSNCTGLTSIDIPSTVTRIGDNAFRDCHNLASVTIPSSVTAIGNNAFMDCRALTDVILPNSISIIEDHAFDGCSSLTSVTVPNSVNTIDIYAFQNCSALTDIALPTSVTTIGAGAFENCTSLTSFVVRKSQTVGNGAFSGCTSLKTVYNLTNTQFYAGNTYMGCVAEHAIRVLDSVGDLSQRGFTNYGTGSNALHQINNNRYTVVDKEDGIWNHIPRTSIPANFLYLDGGNAKSASGWKANEIVLADGQDAFEAPEAFTADTATYSRSFTNGNRSTLYLPFTAAIPDGFEVYAFSGFDNSTIYFAAQGDSVRAYTPYLVGYDLSKADNTDCTIGKRNAKFPQTVSASYHPVEHNGMTFSGVISRTEMTSTNNYGYSNGFFVQSGGHAHVNPFRCYFTYHPAAGAPQNLPATLFIDCSDNSPMGIGDVENPDRQNSIRYSNDVYDLMGRLVRKNAETLEGLPRGVYIWRGKKVLCWGLLR